MTAIEPIQSISIEPLRLDMASQNNSNIQDVGFSNLLQNELVNSNSKIAEAEKLVQSLALGEAENLHQVMSSIQEAKLSFEMIVQVRNRLLEGYQEIMKMQV